MITNFNKREKAIMNREKFQTSALPLERDHGDLSAINENCEINEWLWVSTSGKMIEIEPPSSPIRMVGRPRKCDEYDL